MSNLPVLARKSADLARRAATSNAVDAFRLIGQGMAGMIEHAVKESLTRTGAAAPEVRTVNEPTKNRLNGYLMTVIAAQNRCRVFHHHYEGYCKVIGYPGDIDFTVALYNSLFAHLHREMSSARTDAARTEAWDHDFALRYVQDIDARLGAIKSRAMAEMSDATGLAVSELIDERDQRVERDYRAFLGRTPHEPSPAFTFLGEPGASEAGHQAAMRADL